MKPYYQDEWVTIYHGDCREILPQLDVKVDLVLTDPPYGITACEWDAIIPLDLMWNEFLRVVENDSAIILTASQPFTSELVMSNKGMFKCEWIWKKNAGSNFAVLKYQPMKEHESVLIFSKGTPKYNPQMQERSASGEARVLSSPMTFNRKRKEDDVYNNIGTDKVTKYKANKLRYPSSVQCFNRERGSHPTQKPTELFMYFIKTYSLENNLILDPFLGSGTTAYCAKLLNRKCIGIEIEEKYCEIAANRCRQMVFDLRV